MIPSMDATTSRKYGPVDDDPDDLSYLRVGPSAPAEKREPQDEDVSYLRLDGVRESPLLESALFPKSRFPDPSIQEAYEDMLVREKSRIGVTDDLNARSGFEARNIAEVEPLKEMIFVRPTPTHQVVPELEAVKRQAVPRDPDDFTYFKTNVAKPSPLLESALFPNAPISSNLRCPASSNPRAGNIKPHEDLAFSDTDERERAVVKGNVGAKDTPKDRRNTKKTAAEKKVVRRVPQDSASKETRGKVVPKGKSFTKDIPEEETPDVMNKRTTGKDVSRGKVVSKDVLEDDSQDIEDDDETAESPGATGATLGRSGPGDEETGGKRPAPWGVSKQGLLVTTMCLLVVTLFFVIIQQTFPAESPKDVAQESEIPKEKKRLERRSWLPASNESIPDVAEYEETSSSELTTSDFRCGTVACRWQRRVMDSKLNLNADPCKDFYSYVCSESWEADGELPYRAAGSAYIVTKVTEFIREHEHAVRKNRNKDRPNFLDHASLFLTSCLGSSNPGGLAQWDEIRALLRHVGLDDWPYLVPPPPPFHLDDVLKSVDRQLAIFPFVHVSLRKRAEDGDYIPHLDAPRSFLFVRHELQRDPKSIPYKETIRRVLTLWKSIRKSNSLAQEIVGLERGLFNASQPPRKQVWTPDMVVPVTEIPKLPRLHLDVYVWHLRPETKVVAILNPVYFSRLSAVLRKPTPRTFLNFIGVWVVVMTSPFLPENVIPRELVRMSHPYRKTYLDARYQSCFHLVERLFPHGVRWILRSIMTERGALDHQWKALTRDMVSALAHSFREGTAWMEGIDVSSAVKRLKSLRVDFLAGREQLDDITSYYPDANVTFKPTTALKDYTHLLNGSLAKYWATQDGSDYDARYSDTSMSADINWERSPEAPGTVYLSSGIIASASLVTNTKVPPTLIPLVAADLARALFISSLEESSWSGWIKDKFRLVELCLLNRLKKRLGAASSNARNFIFVTLADSAILKPLLTAFQRVGGGAEVIPGMLRSNLTLWRYFFINYASGLCVHKAEDRQALDRMRLGVGLPARTRVNLAVLGLPQFRRAFSCPGRLLTPHCSIWVDHDVNS